MATQTAQVVRRHLRRAVAPLDSGSDVDLLRHFVNDGDSDAFARIVSRHGPMVLGVCERILGPGGDAEDAFQNTFITLARQAPQIREGVALASWLHRVARRTAAKSRSTPTVEAEPSEVSVNSPDPLADVVWREARQIVDEELARLPEDLREPLILCYLEGITRDEAAHRLGWSLATLKRRLAEGRRTLHDRLIRRGCGPVGLVAAILGSDGLQGSSTASSMLRTQQSGLPRELAERTTAQVQAISASTVPHSFTVSGIFKVSLIMMGLVAIGFGAVGVNTPKASEEAPIASAQPTDEETERVDSGFPLPEGALFRIGDLRWRHPTGINHAAISADGKRLVTTAKTTVAVWELETGRCLRMFRDCGVPDGVGANLPVDISPDGRLVVHAMEFGHQARVWDVESGEELCTIGEKPLPKPGPQPRMPGSTLTMRFTGDGKEVMVISYTAIVFYDAETGQLRRRSRVPGTPTGFTPDGKRFASVDDENNVKSIVLGETETGKELARIVVPQDRGANGLDGRLALSNDGKRVAAMDGSTTIRVWDGDTGKEIASLERPDLGKTKNPDDLPFTICTFSQDGDSLFAGTRDGQFFQFDLTGKQKPTLLGSHWQWITGLLAVPRKNQLVSVSWDRTIRRWDLTTKKQLPMGDGYVGWLASARSPDGKTIVVSDAMGRLELWGSATGEKQKDLAPQQSGVTRIAFSPNGQHFATGHYDGLVNIWETRSGKRISTLGTPKKSPRQFFGELTFSPDGKQLVVAGHSKGLHLWDLTPVVARKEQPTWIVTDDSNSKAAFSPDGKILVTGGWDSKVHFRDPKTGKEQFSVDVPADPTGQEGRLYVDDVTFSPAGDVFATTHHDGLIRIWDRRGKVVKYLKGHQEVCWCVEFSRDGKWLVSGGLDHTVRVWELATGRTGLVLNGHDAWIQTATFGPLMKTVFSADDSTALMWLLKPADLNARSRTPKEWWKDLQSEQAGVAYRAIWALLDDPTKTVALLKDKIPPATSGVDKKEVQELITRLGSERFTVREKAMQKLAEMGKEIQPLLEEALKKDQHAEIERRLQTLLKQIDQQPGPEGLRQSRAVQILEMIGSDEAKIVLHTWAEGAVLAPLTEDARRALERME